MVVVPLFVFAPVSVSVLLFCVRPPLPLMVPPRVLVGRTVIVEQCGRADGDVARVIAVAQLTGPADGERAALMLVPPL